MKINAMTEMVKNSAAHFGFDAITISSAYPLEQDGQRYQNWCADGYAAGLQYMMRPFPRRWVPQDLLPSARSVISLAVNFYGDPHRVLPRSGFGRVARYAWGLDYHEVLLQRISEWLKTLKESAGSSMESKILIDSSPLLERAFAARGNMGFIGKNTLLISRKLGSFIFLAEVLTNLDLSPDLSSDLPPDLPNSIASPNVANVANVSNVANIAKENSKDACGSCRQCIVDCPTNALQPGRRLDARKCISFWTIENRSAIPLEMREGIGHWVFGCDVCQEVCPYEGISPPSRWKEFSPSSGCGPYLSIVEILEIQEEEDFKNRFRGTPILRTKRDGLVRNACIVAGNQKLQKALPHLEKILQKDKSPMVQEHAQWAIQKIIS